MAINYKKVLLIQLLIGGLLHYNISRTSREKDNRKGIDTNSVKSILPIKKDTLMLKKKAVFKQWLLDTLAKLISSRCFKPMGGTNRSCQHISKGAPNY